MKDLFSLKITLITRLWSLWNWFQSYQDNIGHVSVITNFKHLKIMRLMKEIFCKCDMRDNFKLRIDRSLFFYHFLQPGVF